MSADKSLVLGNDKFSAALAVKSAELAKLVRDTVFKNATDAELALYFHSCERHGVHPLDKMMYPMVHVAKDGTRTFTLVTSIDLFRARSADTGQDAGMEEEYGPSVSCTFMKREWKEGPNGKRFPQDTPFQKSVPEWVRCTVMKLMPNGHIAKFSHTAYFSEYLPAPGNQGMWEKMPRTMLAKCAEAAARRKAFPRELSKLYEQAEMEQAKSRDLGEADVVEQVAGAAKLSEAPPQVAGGAKYEPPSADVEVLAEPDKGTLQQARARFFAMVAELVKAGQAPDQLGFETNAGKALRSDLIEEWCGERKAFHDLQPNEVDALRKFVVDKYVPDEDGGAPAPPIDDVVAQVEQQAKPAPQPGPTEPKAQLLKLIKEWVDAKGQQVVSTKSAHNTKLLVSGLLSKRVEKSEQLSFEDWQKALDEFVFNRTIEGSLKAESWKEWCEARIKGEAVAQTKAVEEEAGVSLDSFEPVEVVAPMTVDGLKQLADECRKHVGWPARSKRAFIADHQGREYFVDAAVITAAGMEKKPVLLSAATPEQLQLLADRMKEVLAQ